MTITLWGRKTSANVQKTVWALAELGLAYEHKSVGGRYGGLDTPEYRALNPNALVPTLCDGDLVVWESHATVRYLAAQYGAGRLWPSQPRDRAVVDQWTDWTATTFQPAWLAVFWRVVRTAPEQQDPAAIAKAIADADRAFGMLDVQLAGKAFIAGDDLTYADIAAGVALYRWFTMEIDRRPAANVESWYSRLQERPAFREAVMVSYEELRARATP
jgi:glutathione S-transferase